jgi:hypothetical protein
MVRNFALAFAAVTLRPHLPATALPCPDIARPLTVKASR